MVCLYSILCTLAGLLAGLWEFPCTAVKPDCPVQRTWRLLQKCLSVETEQHTFQGTVGMTPTYACTPLTRSHIHNHTCRSPINSHTLSITTMCGTSSHHHLLPTPLPPLTSGSLSLSYCSLPSPLPSGRSVNKLCTDTMLMCGSSWGQLGMDNSIFPAALYCM